MGTEKAANKKRIPGRSSPNFDQLSTMSTAVKRKPFLRGTNRTTSLLRKRETDDDEPKGIPYIEIIFDKNLDHILVRSISNQLA